MTVPRQSAVWDESRNTSRLRPPSPTALPDALRALAKLRETHPALVAWIEAGHPPLSEAEHVRRFGVAYKATRKRAA